MEKIVICKSCGRPEYWGADEMALREMHVQGLLQSRMGGKYREGLHLG